MNSSIRKFRGFGTSVAIGVCALTLAACGSDNNNATKSDSAKSKVACASGTISGAGSTFAQTIVQQWIKDYAAACPGATVNYQGVGSGAGIQQFTAGTVDFGASDVPMKAEEQTAAEAKGGKVLHIPWSSGGIAVTFHLTGVKELNLSPQTLAGIFAGKVTKWDAPEIKSDNPGTTLPATGIQVVHRSDGSGTTAAFTAYLTATAPAVWTVGTGKDVAWPAGQGAKGSDGVTAAVKSSDGAISYVELSFAKANSLGIAKIKNEAGKFVEPTENSVAEALKDAEVPADLKVKVNYKPAGESAYPISTLTWVIVHEKSTDPAKAGLLKSFITFALTGGQESAGKLYYAPLPNTLLEPAKLALATIG